MQAARQYVTRGGQMGRRSANEECPYCSRRMYEVESRTHPNLEVHLCYACGGCVVYEVLLNR